MNIQLIISFLASHFSIFSGEKKRYYNHAEVQLFTGQGSSSIFALGVKIHNWTENSPSTTTIPLEILQSTHAVIEIEFSKLGKSQLELKIFRDGALTGGERFHDDFVDESGDIEVYASDSNLPVSISDVIVQFLFR